MEAAPAVRLCNRCTLRPAVAVGNAGALCEPCLRGEFTTAIAKLKPGALVARNAPCPCGSGKKYKACHGRPLALLPANGLAAPVPPRPAPVRILPADDDHDVKGT